MAKKFNKLPGSVRVKVKRVGYVIGDFLGQPVIMEHIVVLTSVKEDRHFGPSFSQKGQAKTTAKNKDLGKRTCGQAQWSSREARRERIGKKK